MKILVADKIADSGVDFLRQQPDFEVVTAYGSSPEELLKLVVDVDAIIVRSASTITAEIMQAAPLLKVVGRAGVGVDNIDVKAATQRGVIVMNTPDGNTLATAELTFTHLLCSARPIAQADAAMKAGRWDKKAYSKGAELNGKTLGILGLGRIGSEVAKRARAFNMRVLAYDPFLTSQRANQLNVEKVELEELLPEADFITVHMPKTEATYKILNAEAFAQMKDGVRVLNCARGGLIDEAALADALESGKVAAAGLDVFEDEPLPEDSPLRKYPNVVMTPHLGASTIEAQENVGQQVAEQIAETLQGGRVLNAINMPSIDPAVLKELRPYLDLGYKLGTLVQQATPDQVDKIKITYSGKIVNLDAMPLTRSIMRGYLAKIAENVNDVNAPHYLERLGVEMEVVKSTLESDFTELVRIEGLSGDNNSFVVEGSLFGKSFNPRLVHVSGRNVEAPLEGWMILLENQDVPGIVGMVGSVLAKHSLNIASMSLSRNTLGDIALNICTLDSRPPSEAIEEIASHPDVRNVQLVDLNF